MKGIWFRLFLPILFVAILVTTASIAQPGDPGGDPDNPVPIGGLELLLIGGAALGAKKIISSRKKG
ncbi:MAG: hypothetical protein ACFB2Y_03015 [Fulvivirga sp.]